MLDLSVILPLRDAEAIVAPMVHGAAALVPQLAGLGQLGTPVGFEILTLDERSGDNTLSVVSLLHGQVSQLRTVQDVEPGTALARASQVARGRLWAIMDRPVSDDLARWAIEQVACGHRAAIIPGEILAVERELGRESLTRRNGGLVSAQSAVRRTLARRGEQPAFSPAPNRGILGRALLRAREAAGRVGLGRLDRPRKGVPGGSLL